MNGILHPRLNTIRREDVLNLHTEIGKRRGKAGPGARDCHYTANRVVALVRVLLNWAIDEENWQGEIQRDHHVHAATTDSGFVSIGVAVAYC
jgi:hypothetical protein